MGLRHGFGVRVFASNVPPHLVPRGLGHASLRTTSIHGDVTGALEGAFATRMWRSGYCFSDPADARKFVERFGGETFDPSERGRGANWAQWKKP